VAKPCGRCVVTTTDQITGERGRQPLKMLGRWTVNLKYVISMPEYMLNF